MLLNKRKAGWLPAWPNISFIGYPVSVPCAGHAGLGLREAGRLAAPAIIEHYRELDATDRRMRFCATLNDEALGRHVDRMWSGTSLVLVARDGPHWSGPLHRAGPIRAVATVDRRCGGGTRHQRGVGAAQARRRDLPGTNRGAPARAARDSGDPGVYPAGKRLVRRAGAQLWRGDRDRT